MAGITITFEDAPFLRRISRVAERARPAVLAVLGVTLVDQTTRRFLSQKAPDGTPWAALNPAYAAIRRPGPILTQSGALRGSITFRPGSNSVQVGSAMVYAGVQQFGGVIRPVRAKALRFHLKEDGEEKLVAVRSVTIPARPYLGLSADDEADLEEAASGAIGRLLG